VIKAPNIVQPRPSQSRPCSGDDHAAPGCCFEQHSVLQSFSRLIGCFSKAATQKCRTTFLHSAAARRVKYKDVLNALLR